MKTKFHEFINESNINFNKYELTKRISDLKKWLVVDHMRDKSEALDLMNIIDSGLTELFPQHKHNLSSKEIEKFNSGLDALYKTDFPKWYIKNRLSEKLPDGIENAKIFKLDSKTEVDEKGNPIKIWCFLNKLNTNYYDLSDLLVYVIQQMLSDSNKRIVELAETVYNTIMSGDVKGGLMLLKTKEGESKGIRLKTIIKTYVKDLPEFLNFTKNSVNNSREGEYAENAIKDFLERRTPKFKIEHQGGNGDFIDMIFGCDLIVFREDIGYKSIQVKNYMPKKEDTDYYKVDWLAVYDRTWHPRVVIKDIKTYKDLTGTLNII